MLFTILGYLAGTILSVSALPRVFGIIHNPNIAVTESVIRNAMLCIGNAIWVIYGSGLGIVPVVVMCTIGTASNGLVLILVVRAKFRAKRTYQQNS